MPPCYCRTYSCNGATQAKSTRKDHLRKDEAADRAAALAALIAQNSRAATSSSAIPPSHPVQASLGQEDRAQDFLSSDSTHTFQDPPSPLERGMSAAEQHAERDARLEAEERGRAHIARARASDNAPTAEDDIGSPADEDDEEDEIEEREGEGGAGSDASIARTPPTRPEPPTSAGRDQPSERITCDPRYPGENDVDPFMPKEATTQARESLSPQGSGGERARYLLYLFVAWLHTQSKVAFKACAAALIVIAQIVVLAGGTFEDVRSPFRSLPSVLNALNIEPEFSVLPTCPKCLEPHPADHPRTGDLSVCARCRTPLFQSKRRHNQHRAADSKVHQPALQFPHKSIESQLRNIIPHVEDDLDAWRRKERTAGKYIDGFDGRIPCTLAAPNGVPGPFFVNPLPASVDGSAPELRIGLTGGLDWFSYLRSLISASHSSGPISFNIINLLDPQRYRVMNLVIGGILPGPKEQNTDEVQRFMRIFVNELLRLWQDGFVMETPRYPGGRLVRVILICIICDKPAAHKVGGFGSHSHTFFCTRCWIRQSDKATAAAFRAGAFAPRSHEEHVRLMQEYARCASQTARDEFVKKYATRWSELARLPYFDICRMIVIDPMHNLLLGLVKTHFYHIWVQLKVLRKTKELRRFHDILSQMQIPGYLGRLPSLMGIPAGGSLTADQWLIAALIVLPIALPQIWDEYCTGDPEIVRLQRMKDFEALAEKQKAARAAARKEREAAKVAASANVRQSTRVRKKTKRAQWVDDVPEEDRAYDEAHGEEGAREITRDIYAEEEGSADEDDQRAHPNLHPDDPANFAKLTEFLVLVLGDEVTDAEIDKADRLIREYCSELIHLYGPDIIRPNHHYSTYVAECMRDFGPLRNFWTFLFERINKILKSYNSANHSGGELEVSFFREFHRTVQQSRALATARLSGDPCIALSVDAMYLATADDRGTVQALSREMDEQAEDGGVIYALSMRSVKGVLMPDLYSQVLAHLQLRLPVSVRSDIVLGPATALRREVTFFDYAVIFQRRYWASSRTNSRANALIAVAAEHGQYTVGELTTIIGISQPELPLIRLGHVRWLVRAPADVSTDSRWKAILNYRVCLWLPDEYAAETSLIQLDEILGHVVITDARVDGVRRWVSIIATRNGSFRTGAV
ncbi:unnamed protein product [Peniophora sp. CBMAI 1063]|nr:unnamed protein product [Peniophora sp. CBMAI 1063]